ncbi:MAG: hypothetical protein KKD99_13650 [Proteobacteria bacterium]|nr:hypothetical protein [Pseudomonadota bacterium]
MTALQEDGFKFTRAYDKGGYYGILLEKQTESGTIKIIASRGMEPFDYRDVTGLLEIAIQQAPDQFKYAKTFIDEVKKSSNNNDKIYLVGHSMGGVISILGSGVFDLQAVAFEVPGIANMVAKELGSAINPDLITIINAHHNFINSHGTHIKHPIVVNNGGKYCYVGLCSLREGKLNSHGIKDMLNAINYDGTLRYKH